MPKDVTQLVMQRYFINELEKEIISKEKELTERWNTLQKQCDHPTVKIDQSYHSGGYDYVSSVIITHTCTICDKVLKSYEDPKHKGQYG